MSIPAKPRCEYSRAEYWSSAVIFFCFGVSAGVVIWSIFT